jgi:hypothetical protein
MGSSALLLPKSGGGVDWPRQGNAEADASFLTQGQPPLVRSSKVSASTTRSVGIELMRPYADWRAEASIGVAR